MKKRSRLSLFSHLMISTFLIMLVSIFLIALIIVTIDKITSSSFILNKRLIPFVGTFILSAIISLFFTLVMGRKVLKPVEDLIKATKKVAKGDLNVHLSEDYKKSAISDVNIHFNKMVRELRGIETFKNDFIVNVSHEFKTPIAAIEGYATLLQDKDLSEAEHDEYTKMIIESSRQLSILSSNILKLSKLENQEIIAKPTIYKLDEQIRQALLLLEVNWSKKNLELDIDLPTIKFLGSEELLIQVWVNLLSNAIKFTPENGSIHITMKQIEKQIVLKISDTGIGMTEDIKKHIFEKFYQGNKNRNVEGNGLGLTLVKRIIDLCNGEIEVQSEAGKGSTFTVKLENNYEVERERYNNEFQK